MKKVVLTGSTGLIGKEATNPLKERGFEVHCLTSKNCNLFDKEAVEKFFNEIRPEYLLHFAWYTGTGYLESELNHKYVQASLDMLKVFKKNGGKRAVFAGTCFEYKFKDEPLKETDELAPQTLYARCKCELREKAEKCSKENGVSFGWGRIFYVYGHNEAKNRLTAYILNGLNAEKKVKITYGQLIRDYMYSKDIAGAFVKFLCTNIVGCVNICSNKEITLKDFACKFAHRLDKTECLEICEDKTAQPLRIVGDNTRLIQEVGYKVRYTLEQAIEEIVNESRN